MKKLLIWLLLPALLAQPAAANTAHDALFKLFDKAWAEYLDNHPGFASTMGHQEYDTRWPDLSPAARERKHQQHQSNLKTLQAIDLKQLDAADQLNYKLFEYNLKLNLESYEHRWFLVPLNQRGGIQTEDGFARQLSFKETRDYRAWLARLKAFPTYMDQYINNMRTGMAEKILLPKVVMKRIPAQIDAQLVEDPKQSGFYHPFTTMPEGVDSALAKQGETLIREQVIPAYARFKRFFEDEYLPACMDQVGIAHLPDGKKKYAYFARLFTTTDLTPEEIHEIGQQEVKRIRAQMQQIIDSLEFEGDFSAFLNYLRTDERFYYKTGEELYEAYLVLSKKIDPTLVKLFDKMPRMPYGVEPIPDSFAPDTTTAYYQSPNPDGSRAGIYYVNLYRPETRPIYEMEALSLHEAVPGHHFQIALAQELGDLPNFRRYNGNNAYAEGWALYAESLGEDLGFYKDPYSKFGQLTYEMWRAVRLVVDTGIHYMGWDRDRAIAFFRANAAKSEHDIINEIDRYIAWPGQALGYKIGELKIKELRKRAEDQLGARFDLRLFHNVVLDQGPMPLALLEERVDAWIQSGGKW